MAVDITRLWQMLRLLYWASHLIGLRLTKRVVTRAVWRAGENKETLTLNKSRQVVRLTYCDTALKVRLSFPVSPSSFPPTAQQHAQNTRCLPRNWLPHTPRLYTHHRWQFRRFPRAHALVAWSKFVWFVKGSRWRTFLSLGRFLGTRRSWREQLRPSPVEPRRRLGRRTPLTP